MPDMGSVSRNFLVNFPHLSHLSWAALLGITALVYLSMMVTLWLICWLRGNAGSFKDCAMLVLVSIPFAIIPPAALLLMGLALFNAAFGSTGQSGGTK